jgi:hypothetical protein
MQEENSLSTFPEDVQKAVEGLAWLGYLEETFKFAGHRFTIRTLKGEEDLMVGLLCEEFKEGNLARAKAWAWANVALAVVAVDGDRNFCPPIGPDPEDHARAKFRYMTSEWYWPLGEYIFEKYGVLVQRQRKAIRAVQDLSERSLHPSTPSRDSLNEPGDLHESTSTEDQT